MRFSLELGLVLRHGKRMLEFKRELDHGEVQLEDVLTRRVTVMKSGELVKRIFKGDLQVVAPSEVSGAPGRASKQFISLGSLSPRHRDVLDYRYQYIGALRKARITRGRRSEVERCIATTAAKIADANPPSASTVMRWMRLYESSSNNVGALVDGRIFQRPRKRIKPVVERVIHEELKKSYFTPERQSLSHAYDRIRVRLDQLSRVGQPKLALSYTTLSRRVQDVDLYQRVASREGIARARYICRTSFPEGSPSYPMEQVEFDHTPLNWVVVCDRTHLPLGRPTLTAMLDAYSSYVLGFYLSFYGPGLTSVAGVVRHGVMPKDELIAGMGLSNRWLSHGLGDEWVLDNGLEFHSEGFKQMGMALGVDLKYCRVRTPWLKPHVERFFGSLNTLTLVKGRVSKPAANLARIDPYKDAAISFSDLVVGLIQFFVDVHPFQINQRKLATPYDLFAEGIAKCPPALYPGSLDELRLVAAPSKLLKLGHGGVEMLGLPYGSVEFGPLVKRHGPRLQVLCKWDLDDMGVLYVQDPETKRWLVARCRWEHYAAGLSQRQHQLIRAYAREQLKVNGRIDALIEAKQRLHEHWMEATKGRRTRAGSLLAGRFANFTSANVLGTGWQTVDAGRDSHTPTQSANGGDASRLVIESQVGFDSDGEIPDFDSYSLRR